jgi:hypothetical protein
MADVPVLSECEVQRRGPHHGRGVARPGVLKNLGIDGYGWPYLISLNHLGTSAKPLPHLPPGFRWDRSLLSSKLKEVQQTTALSSDGGLRYPEEWAAVFGRLTL